MSNGSLGLQLYRKPGLSQPFGSIPCGSSPPSQIDYSDHVVVRPIEGKGLGLVATQSIPQHVLISEDPALIGLYLEENLLELYDKYLALPASDKASFDGLAATANSSRDAKLRQRLLSGGHNPGRVEHMLSISQRFLANAFNIGDEDLIASLEISRQSTNKSFLQHMMSRGGHARQDPSKKQLKRAVFPLIARINHSCVPNAHVHYQPASCSQALYSLRPIAVDEEITIAYFDLTLPFDSRLQRAQDWGFRCQCPVCKDPMAAAAMAHEESLQVIRAVISQAKSTIVGLGGSSNDIRKKRADSSSSAIEIATASKALNGAIQRVQDYAALQPVLPLLYDLLGTIEALASFRGEAIALRAAARQNLTRAHELEVLITGGYSPSSQRRRCKADLFDSDDKERFDDLVLDARA